ncbi:hypothetical protein P9B03_05185 [Metasolibacillus meyeri]|uniref:DUF4179 domain-containing protein n=1 Tax=Metasolibacillus meyeri TaxID=1071052 RepID=A0AAW9NKB6_9BACL|nr:hypothetical protein [Metasolibacillus meyeri]MEC1177870.1 hypothetical protein [Metasolibacillus meyeri]
MKDIYKIFNEVDIDVEQFEEMEVTAFDKKLLKKQVKSKITRAKKSRSGFAALALAAVFVASTFIGLSFTSMGENIPFVRGFLNKL